MTSADLDLIVAALGVKPNRMQNQDDYIDISVRVAPALVKEINRLRGILIEAHNILADKRTPDCDAIAAGRDALFMEAERSQRPSDRTKQDLRILVARVILTDLPKSVQP